MKYRLANRKITENYARELLEERGVEDYISFLAPSVDMVNAPTNLENIKEGADILLETVKKPGHLITLIIDCDVDGFTSSTILWQYLHEICPQVNISYEIHSGKQHGLEDIFDKIEGMKVPPDLVIVPDAGSNDYRYHEGLKAHGITTLVLDHHEADHLSEDAIIINNQLSPNYTNKALTGAGVVWQFCKYIDSILGITYADKYIDLAALGLVADMSSVLTLENRYIIKEGLENVQNFFFKVLVDKQSFSLGNKLTPIGISFYIAPLVNALIRVGSMQEKENLFLAFIDGTQIVNSTKRGEKGLTEKLAIQVARDCTNSRNRQNRVKEKAVEALEVKIAKHDLLDNKILLVRLEDDDDFPAVLNGSTLLAR